MAVEQKPYKSHKKKCYFRENINETCMKEADE